MLLKTCVCLLVSLVICEEISFKNISIEWKLDADQHTTNITSSNDLKQNVPDGDVVTVTVTGLVPVLYRNAVSDLKLQSLTLSNVGLEEIRPGAFRNLSHLNHLILNHNKLRQIVGDTFIGLNLSSLNLADNYISSLQPEAFAFLHLNHLTLSNNKLEQVKKNVFANVSLQSLHLHNNKLKRVDADAFADLGLATLTLSNNQLTQIDLKMSDVRFLDVSFNQIMDLQVGALANLPQLGTLDLVANKLTHIPEGVFNGTKLTHLKLNYNEISSIESGAFDDMTELSVLHIDHNRLNRWDNEWLYNSANLAYIFAGYNNITELPAQAFKNYPKMFNINLENNKIDELSPNTFDKSLSFVNFGLSDNELSFWDAKFLLNVNIGTLDLSNNQLKCVNGDLHEVFINVNFLHLAGNPWESECGKKIESFVEGKIAKLTH